MENQEQQKIIDGYNEEKKILATALVNTKSIDFVLRNAIRERLNEIDARIATM